jgi:chromosome segregation ATPase
LPQEIIWTAVREFWLRLVTGFERLENYKGIQEKISNLEQRLTVFEEMCPQLRLEAENERDRVEQYMVKLDDKTREIERLTMVLRDAEDEKERERERQHVLVARLRASVCSTTCSFGTALIDRVAYTGD